VRPPRDLSALTGDPGAEIHPAAIASVGGALLFEFKAAPTGVHVIRVHRRDDGTKLYCSVLFDDERAFLDWIDADPVRFQHPLVFQQARRCFAELLVQGGHDGAVRN
jgi:hypothetical protein